MTGKCFFISLIFLICSVALYSQSVYYRSDSVGLELEIINKYRLDEFEYVLEVEKTPQLLEKTLFRNQKEYRRWETYYNENGVKTVLKEFENNNIVFNTEFDRKGNRKYEELYSQGILQEKKIYSYSSRGIDYVDTLDSRDKKLYTDEYEISPAGRLRAIRRLFPSGRVDIRHYTYSAGRLVEEWEYSEGRIFILVYNEDGKLVRRETWEKDTLQIVANIEYDPNTRKIIREIEKDLENDISIERRYDKNGLMEKEIIDKGDGFPSDTTYEYRDGKVVSLRRKSSIGVEEWKYYHDASGRLTSEDYYRRGFLEMHTVYKEDDSWYEEILRNEEVFVRVFYENNKKVREEFIQEGNVIRTRDYD
ncbi:MAG: hypothetical protein JW904_03405 [Spirochaetales bacterium]|nr:hypothetical protein [Spirochaetales bacterium]